MKYYCDECGDECQDYDLVPETEPHGEVLLWTPCCKAAPIPEDEYDPTPYCHGCGATRKIDCECGRYAKNH